MVVLLFEETQYHQPSVNHSLHHIRLYHIYLTTFEKLIKQILLIITWQIYVEIERARLTKTLAKIKEDSGKVTEAANILQELQVILVIYKFFSSLYHM